MKKSICALFLVFCVFLCGCQTKNVEATDGIFEVNAFRILRQIDNDGKICLSYIFPVNSKLIEEKFSEEEISVYKFYLANYVNALAKANKEKQSNGVLVSGCEYYTDIDGIGFSIIFENSKVQNEFFSATSEEGEANEEKAKQKLKTEGLFLKKTYIETQFPISTTKTANDVKTICLLAISSWCKDCNISEKEKNEITNKISEACFIYDFSTTSQDLKSNFMYKDGNYYHNVFIKSTEEIEQDSTIKFWVENVDKGLCYIVTLVLVCIGMLIAFLILNRKKRI